jgi:predicted nuclease of predicted toxin-antitoxin system
VTLPLYLDHNVHGAITAGLRRRGIDCLTAQEDGMAQAGDPAILDRASRLQRVLFTHDDDLLVIA